MAEPLSKLKTDTRLDTSIDPRPTLTRQKSSRPLAAAPKESVPPSPIASLFSLPFSFFLSMVDFCFRATRPKSKSFGAALLRIFLNFELRNRRQTITRLSRPVFGGIHPKNVFNFRSDWFLEQITLSDRVLDIACGTGLLMSELSTKAESAVGIDNDPNNLKAYTRNFERANTTFLLDDIFKVNYEQLKQERGITVVTLSHILEHLEDPIEFLKRLPFERVLICVPSQENWISQLRQHLGANFLTDATHFREYTREMLSTQLKDAGFTPEYLGFNSEGEIVCIASRS